MPSLPEPTWSSRCPLSNAENGGPPGSACTRYKGMLFTPGQAPLLFFLALRLSSSREGYLRSKNSVGAEGLEKPSRGSYLWLRPGSAYVVKKYFSACCAENEGPFRFWLPLKRFCANFTGSFRNDALARALRLASRFKLTARLKALCSLTNFSQRSLRSSPSGDDSSPFFFSDLSRARTACFRLRRCRRPRCSHSFGAVLGLHTF